MGKYIVHKPVAPEKVKKKLQRSLEDYAATYEAQPKYDGCCAIIRIENTSTYVCHDVSIVARSRTGEYNYALQGLADEIADRLRRDIVLIGEAWWPGEDQFSEISGEFRRHQASDKLFFVINDVLTVEEFDAGHSPVPYRERIARLDAEAQTALPVRVRVTSRFDPGTYGNAQTLCNEFVTMGGYDGLILRDPEGTWTVGSGTTGEVIKLKRKLSYDLRVLEVNTAVGEKTGRTVYKLVVDFGGKRLGVGSGVPHDFDAVPKVGQIVEVEAMDKSSDGLLREPRFKGIRYDKLEADAA